MQDFLAAEEKIKKIYSEYNRIMELLTYEEVLLDKKLFLRLDRERVKIEDIAVAYSEYLKIVKNNADIKNMLDSLSGEERLEFEREEKSNMVLMDNLEGELIKKLISLGAEMQTVVIEIAEGSGEVSAILKSDLITGYTVFAEDNGLTVSYEKEKNTLTIEGLNAAVYFEDERAVHSAIKDKKVGSCRVFVYEGVVGSQSFSLDDVEISATRSSGAGGQHINTTDSAIRAIHLPTKISVYVQEERSQVQNKETALTRLKDKVLEHYASEYRIKCDALRKEQLKTMKDSDVKVYNYDEGVITDKFGRKIELKDFLKGKSL